MKTKEEYKKMHDKIRSLPFFVRVLFVVFLGIPIIVLFTVFVIVQLFIFIAIDYHRSRKESDTYRWRISEEYGLYRSSLTSWLYHTQHTDKNEIQLNDWLKMIQYTDLASFESYVRDLSLKSNDLNTKRVVNGYFRQRIQFLNKPISRFCLVY